MTGITGNIQMFWGFSNNIMGWPEAGLKLFLLKVKQLIMLIAKWRTK